MGKKGDPISHVGETHGIYTIVDMLNEKDKYGHWTYKCRCNECGYEKFTHYGSISGKGNIATECKHLRINGSTMPYGHTWSKKRIGTIFNDMVSRCYDNKDKNFIWYGEKGVKIFEGWMNNPKAFEVWALNNGYDDSLTIDRIDSRKDYCPDNCQWIPLEENSRKAGNVNWITVDEHTLTGRQWAEKFGLGKNRINTLIREFGVEKTKELIAAMLVYPPSTKERKPNQSWFDVYGIQI